MNVFKRDNLIKAIINRPKSQRDKINEILLSSKETAKRKDWLWHLILASMATMGGSSSYKTLIENAPNYYWVSYETLCVLNDKTRRDDITTWINLVHQRYNYAQKKPDWLIMNFNFIQDCGGLAVVQNFILNISGPDSKVQFMKNFHGIGDKYCRNIFMDIYHEDFINSIAVDSRLLQISDLLELKGTYNEKESMFIEIAKEAGITPWELDRLLYTFKDYYIRELEQ